MWTYRYGAAALAVATALAGCSAATTTTKPDPDPEPAAPSLLGTWEITLDPDDYGEARHRVLTFRPNRYVVVVTERDAFGAIIGTGNVSGGWEQSDTHLTKIYLDDEADNAAVSVPKRYTLTADTLTVQEWVNNAADARDITYTRVTDPAILTTPAGSRWTLENNDAGNMQSWTLAFTDAGWSYTYRDNTDDFAMGGATWTEDAEAGVMLAVVGSVNNPNWQWWIGQALHFAYAPNGQPDVVNVSPWFAEQGVTGEGDARMRTAPHPDTPYGDFWHRFTRAE